MRVADFAYELPPELIAQSPADRRDASRLLVLRRQTRTVEHNTFRDLLAELRLGDVLVLNNSRVIPARLRATKAGSGGQIELLLVEENTANDWWVMLRPGKRVRPGTVINLHDLKGQLTALTAEVLEKNAEGHCRLRFSGTENIVNALDNLGELPLPPYIERPAGESSAKDQERYQTVYAQPAGSVAAPTAGLHFTPELLAEVRAKGVSVQFVTLHVGLGTFLPVKSETVEAHTMHRERFTLSPETVNAIYNSKLSGGRVIAVGTTSVRVLESVARANGGKLVPTQGSTDIFIYPPAQFQVVDALLTNFHLPESTLLMLVSAFASPGKTDGREWMLANYAAAIRERYRFFSYGDAMLLTD